MAISIIASLEGITVLSGVGQQRVGGHPAQLFDAVLDTHGRASLGGASDKSRLRRLILR